LFRAAPWSSRIRKLGIDLLAQIANATSIATKEAVAWELDEAQQLKAVITQAIKTAQSSPWRGGPS
jgi:hypothetical protein